MRKATEKEKDVFYFLNILRNSGLMNMYEAAPSIRKNFDVTKKESHKLLSLWMKNFNKECNYEYIKE